MKKMIIISTFSFSTLVALVMVFALVGSGKLTVASTSFDVTYEIASSDSINEKEELSAKELKESLLADLRSSVTYINQEKFYIEQHPKILAYMLIAAKDYDTANQILLGQKRVTSEILQMLSDHNATKEIMHRLGILEGLSFNKVIEEKVVEDIADIIERLDIKSGKGLNLSYLGNPLLPYESKLRSETVSSKNVHSLLLNRWSSLSLSSEPLAHEDILTLIEAARWAPSSFNNQPWRFIYAHRNTESWNKIWETLQTRNKRWVQDAAIMFVLLSKTTLDRTGKFDKSHSFSTGAACQNFSLQAFSMGLVTRCMDRLDFDVLRKTLNIPDEYEIEVVIAVGKPGDQKKLPADLQKRNRPSDRKQISEIMFEGSFPKNKQGI